MCNRAAFDAEQLMANDAQLVLLAVAFAIRARELICVVREYCERGEDMLAFPRLRLVCCCRGADSWTGSCTGLFSNGTYLGTGEGTARVVCGHFRRERSQVLRTYAVRVV